MVTIQLLTNYLNSSISQSSLPNYNPERLEQTIVYLFIFLKKICAENINNERREKRKIVSDQELNESQQKQFSAVKITSRVEDDFLVFTATKLLSEDENIPKINSEIAQINILENIFDVRPTSLKMYEKDLLRGMLKNSKTVALKLINDGSMLDISTESTATESWQTTCILRILLTILGSQKTKDFLSDFLFYTTLIELGDTTMNGNNLIEKYKKIQTDIGLIDILTLQYLNNLNLNSNIYKIIEKKCKEMRV